MHFYSLGDRKNFPLIILHGWGLDGERYRLLAKLLSKEYFVLAPDLPGFGKTPTPQKPFTLNDYARAIKLWMESQGFEKAHFLGHSFGGRISLWLACYFPKTVDRLILTGTPGVERFSIKRSLKRAIFWILAKLTKPLLFIPFLRQYRDRFYEKRDFGNVNGVMRETFLKVLKQPLTEQAKSVRHKTFLLWGQKDTLAPLRDAEKLLSCLKDGYLKIYAKVGHPFPYELPHEFSREVLQFLSSS